jgi:hypothetical protein
LITLGKQTKVTGLDRAVRELAKVDKQIINQLRRDMRQDSTPILKEIVGEVDISAPISGMRGTSRTSWSGVKGGFSFRPNARSKAGGYVPIISMNLRSKGKTAGFEIAEMAGSKNLSFSVDKAKGRQFVGILKQRSGSNFKAGRFGYAEFLKRRPKIQDIVIKIIDDFSKDFNKRIRIR